MVATGRCGGLYGVRGCHRSVTFGGEQRRATMLLLRCHRLGLLCHHRRRDGDMRRGARWHGHARWRLVVELGVVLRRLLLVLELLHGLQHLLVRRLAPRGLGHGVRLHGLQHLLRRHHPLRRAVSLMNKGARGGP